MRMYVCKHCKFKYSAANPKECPYCGRNTLEPEKSASELLNEVDRILNE